MGVGVSLLAIYLLLQQVPLERLGEVLGRAQPVPLLLLVLTALAGLYARAARWRVYFLPERDVAFSPLLGTLSISYMASTFLPFRAGEVVRAVFLGEREALAISRVVGTILLEKLFDFLAIGVLLVPLLLTTPLPGVAFVVGSAIAAVILLGFGFVVALAVWREPTLRLAGAAERRVPLGLGKRVGLARAIAQFAGGTDSLRVPALWGPMLGWTAAAWALALAGTWAGAVAVDLPLGLAPLAFVVVVTSTGQAVPSSPGYVGVYEAATVLALAAFDVDPAMALGAAVLTRAFTYGTLVVAGLVALWLGGYGLREVVRTGVGRRGSASGYPPERAPPGEPAPEPSAAAPARRA